MKPELEPRPQPPRRTLRSHPSKRRGMKIETVQRWVFAVILIHIGGSPTLALAAYSPHMEQIKHSSGVGLWIMSGVVGLATTAGVLLVHQRSLLSPWLILGILPMTVSAFYVF
ncbi:hypothetical protein GCM10009554_44020 [Kribbella koreensis]|uniref:Uncharacterized protein n=2 Tax=Kribbella koreensis TaxID=57909 RepID=A0ABN1QTH8_9ACTN